MLLAAIDQNAQQLDLLFWIVSFHSENPATKHGQCKNWRRLARKCVKDTSNEPYCDGFTAGIVSLCGFCAKKYP